MLSYSDTDVGFDQSKLQINEDGVNQVKIMSINYCTTYMKKQMNLCALHLTLYS